MSAGYVIYLSTPLCKHKVYFVVIHIGVGYLGVARTGELGNAKALGSGTSDEHKIPRLFLFIWLINLLFELSGSGICGLK